MVTLELIKGFLETIEKKVYLPSQYFDISNEHLEKAIAIFKTDWERWFPESIINIEKLYYTPQLISVLCYRIARELYLSGKIVDIQCVNWGGRCFLYFG